MSEHASWAEYLKIYAGGESQGRIAEKMGVDSSTVGRWLRGVTRQPDAKQAVDFARLYGRSPCEALMHAGYLEAHELGMPIEVVGSLSDVSDEALVAELAGRLADFRRFVQVGQDTQDWPPPVWRVKDTGVGGVQQRDQRR